MPAPTPPAVDELLRIVEPPLRYLATAHPRRLAPNALPTQRILALIDRAAAEGGTDRAALGRLRALLAEFPLDAEAAWQRRAEEGLREVERLKQPLAEPPAVGYEPALGDVGAALGLLAAPAQFLKGVGPRRAEQLARFGLGTIEDLLYHLPFRYEDRRSLTPIAQLVPGGEATVAAEILAAGTSYAGRRRRRIFEVKAGDGGGVLTLTWFHQTAYFAQKLRPGVRIVAHGKVETGYGRRQMIHPEVDVLEGEEGELGRIVPIYEKPTEMSVGAMRKIVAAARAEIGERVPSALPPAVARRQRLEDLARAFREVHEPERDADVVELAERRSLAHRSIVFDELFFLELGMMLRKHSIAAEPGISFRPRGELARRLRERLPFRLTGAQRRVLVEIGRDMAAPHPMNRLVQGDVGSGKTVVAVLAALGAIECGYQAALMAPTEILAEQHHATVAGWLAPLGVEPVLLTARLRPRARQAVHAGLAEGAVRFLVGTHAIIQEGVRFARLGLGIIDEQHRFGVLQRKRLKGLGENPDVLLMTATPIPRTLAMTLYGDLELSFLDELPPGRRPIETRVVRERDRERVYERVRRQLDAGRQAYLVFPLIEESEATDLRSAKAMARELATGAFRGYRLALLHGQMKAEEKEAVMRRFLAGDHQLLVATTVIEVGIDVPNATVMVVDHAEQFGLAQLHQLRGRVGRGAERSLCVLVSSGRAGAAGDERLRLLERETSGARIAEADLETRGPGELLGLRQSGLPDFRAANLVRDVRLLEEARREAESFLRADPALGSPPSLAVRQVLEHRWRGRLGLAQVG
ncbi:MAG: ATP-dependent DNA helicase RecG [Deltaproteobacteria bacterium]|nr:ATP-dependent DNA helicase RecG [Deltaproteobacteria bacterium]